ncbi:uncharacterized protein LOC111622018 [Centruroides sculpturatus]|uniref:uncharacterized protein LOC111622018 n=1 Tax=Centruroides sculpturatus TaxID=218467 RepID=UPI000C6E2FD3|nr:uncharacterized protein LOC111622018 [Centruroides sculpturatus]
MPLHRAHFAFSCPILPSHTSFITRATQTDPIDSTFSSFRTSNGEHLFENLRSNSYCKTLNRTNALNTDNRTVGNSIPDYKVACAAQSLKTCLLAVPNAICFQERIDSPISPSFPRNRSFSFVTAIKKGNPHLIDATDSYYCTNVEEKFSQSATDSLTKDNVHSEVPNISYCNSYSNIGKEYSPQIKPCPNEDKEYNRPFINMKNNINSSSQPLQTVLPNVELSKEISKNDKKKNEQTEKCELQLTIGGDSVEDKTSRAKNKKDNNIAEKDRISRNVKRRFSGSDILAAVSILTQCTKKPRTADWNEVKRMFQYLKGTADWKLKLGEKSNARTTLECFVNSDWAGDNTDQKSHTGICL